MKEVNENKKSETESKKPTSPATAPKSPKLPTPATLVNQTNQVNPAHLQQDRQDLHPSKSIQNGSGQTSEAILQERLAPFVIKENSETEKDLDLLKNNIGTKSDDLQILDTKPGLVEQEETKNNITGLNQEEKIYFKNADAPFEDLVFSKALDPNERKHFQLIVKQQKESVSALRKQVQALVAYIGTLPETEDSKALLESLSTL